jgi:hypothetical protein
MGVYLYPNNTETELKNAYIWIPFPESIVLDKSSITLTTIWQTEQLTATIEPTISDKTITWSSDDTTVATVVNGLVTCVTPWTCTITATTVNGLTASCSVGQARLPSAYQEVEYIENNGTAYILTWLNIKDWYRNQMKVRFLVAANADTYPWISWWYLWADSWLPWWHGRFYLNWLQTNWKLNYWYLSSYWDIWSWLATWTDYEIDYSWISWNAFVKLNWNTLQSSSATYSTSLQWQAPIWWWAHMDLNQYWANPWIRIYYSQFYNSAWTLARDFIPCYRKSDNIIGMYDLVNDQFYTNSWTWTFTKWPDVN